MSTRKIAEVTDGLATVKVYWNSEEQEYVCKLYVAGTYNKAADYFTNDKDDALKTAQHMAQHAWRP